MKDVQKYYKAVVLILYLVIVTGHVWAQTADIRFNGSNAPTITGPNAKYITVTSSGNYKNVGIAASGTYQVYGSTSTYYIHTANTNVHLHLHDVSITYPANSSPISFAKDASNLDNEIILYGKNVLRASDRYSAIRVVRNQSLSIREGESGASLECYGGNSSAGIGAGNLDEGNAINYISNLTIQSGKIIARGGYYGAGIGGCIAIAYAVQNGNVTINGGTVEAYGGEYSAGIGYGGHYNSVNRHDPGTVTVNGGDVKAYGGRYAAGIGGGTMQSWGCKGCPYVQTGGKVYASAGIYAAAIGGGSSSSSEPGGEANTVTVTGGWLDAYSQHSSAIGAGVSTNGGKGAKGSDVVISGGTVIVGGQEAGIGGSGNDYRATGTVQITGGSVHFTQSIPPKDITNGAVPVYLVKVDAFGLPETTPVSCSYVGSQTFSCHPHQKYFYFWMPEKTTEDRNLSVNGLNNLLIERVTKDNSGANMAPLLFKSSAGGKYYNLDVLANASDLSLTLQSNINLYKNITTSGNKTVDLQGYKFNMLGTNRFTVAHSVTLKGSANASFFPDINMTGTGILKLDPLSFGNVTLGNTYYNNTPVYLAEMSRNQTYGSFGVSKLREGEDNLPRQYSSGTQDKFYGWLFASAKSLNLISGDGSYFYSDLPPSITQKMKVILKDMTNVYQLSQGDVTVSSLGTIAYFQKSGTSRTSEANKNNLFISETQSSTSANGNVTIQSDCIIQFASGVRCGQLSVDAGVLTLKGNLNTDKVLFKSSGALDLTQATSLTVNNADGLPLGSQVRLGTAPAATPSISLGGKTVWAATIPVTDYGALTEVSQNKVDFVKDRRYFGDAAPYYFWVDNNTEDLCFTAGSPVKYYYAPVTRKHNVVLAPVTFKTHIKKSDTDITRYKSLFDAFAVADDGATVSLIDNATGSNEQVRLKGGKPSVTLELGGNNLEGTYDFDANGGRLTLVSSGNGKIQSATTLSGLVYTEMSGDNMTGTISRNGSAVVRYLVDKPFATGSVFYSSKGYTSEAMMVGDKACLWLPRDAELGDVSLGYSANMDVDKCGEIPALGSLTAHNTNPTRVNPYLNIARSGLEIVGSSSSLDMTYNTIKVTGFDTDQLTTVYGIGTNSIKVGSGADVRKLRLHNLSISLTNTNAYPAIRVESTGKLALFLSGKNNLKGGSKEGSISAGISVAEDATVEINNDDTSDEQQQGTGRLTVKGGAYVFDAAPGIGGNYGEPCGTIIINGGTIKAEGGIPTCHGIGNGGDVVSGRKDVIINAGSVNASREWVDKDTLHAFKNSNGKPVYLMTVNTGLSANKKYQCVYHECSPEPFPVMTDEYGKCYFWIPEQKQADKPTATFIDPATSTPTVIQLVKVDKHDKNVAPIVAELVQPGKETEYHNNLKDAFDAVSSDEAIIRLLIDIDNLTTVQTVKTGRRVTLDLDRFNLDTKNSKEGGFTVETGGYLYITGEGESGTGNIKSTFKISGDIFIAGIVPLTDASPMLADRAVFRTLVKGLPDSPNTIYSYSYGSISNRNFNLHDGIACLWLPDGSGELTFRVTQGSNVTDYTAGTLTTSTQRTDAIASLPVGVIARVVNGAKVQDFNNLSDAFTEAAKTAGNTVRMLANISLTKAVTIETTPDTQYDFTLDLNGFSLDGASGAVITVGPGRYFTVIDSSTGVKGGLNIAIVLNGQMFVSGNINVKGTVTKAGTTTVLWRTMVDVKSMTPEPTEVSLESVTSKVLGSEACFWLTERSNAKLTFTVDGTEYPISGVNINTNHQDNLVTLGVGDDQAMIRGGNKYKTFALAWADALKATDPEIVLLKDATIDASLTMNILDKRISIDVARYSLAATNGATMTVEADNTLVINSSNGNGRMLVPLVNEGVLYIGQGIQADRVTKSVVDGTGTNMWRALVSNLPDGMPDDGTYLFTFGEADGQSDIAAGAQTGSFYVKNGMACVWLYEQKAHRLRFDQFKSWTDNVTIEPNHANQVIWGQSNVAQVLNKMYTELSKAFAENSNQTVTLLKGAVLETTQRITSNMVLALDKYSVSPMGSPASIFDLHSDDNLQPSGSLQVTGNGSLSTDIQIDFSHRVEGSNANLAMEEGVIMNGKVTASTIDYYRATVRMPDDVKGELDYVFGTQTGKVTAVAGKPLTLWLRASAANETNDMKFIQGEKSWLATSVKIVATHVNLISVNPIKDEAKIAGGDYYKTLTLALANAAGTQTVEITRSLSDLTGRQQLNSTVSGTVTLDLKGFTLASAGATFDATNAQLVISNGYLNGELTVVGNIFAHPTLSMENTRVKNGDQVVWRTLVELPSAASVSYTVNGGAPVEVKNTQPIGGKVYACLWLPAANVVSDYVFTVGGKVYPLSNVLITSNHSNELNVANNKPVVKNLTTSQEFATLNTALATAGDNEILQLQADITLLLSQKVDKTLTLDLNGNTLTSSQTGGFVIATDRKLTVKSTKVGTKGLMVGTFILNNDQLAVEQTVNIEGQVLLAGVAHYRVMIKVNDTKRCEWLKPLGFEYDKPITVSGDIWEATVPARLAGHEEQLTAYKVVTIPAGGGNWNASVHADRNIIVPADATWTIQEGTAGSIHRLTIHDGGRVAAKGQVTATEGIRYVRSFATASRWESISLPFNSARIMTIDGTSGEPTLRVPATGSGTAGDFWLNTMQANGQQQTVESTEMSANEAYIMAVPTTLKGQPIYFVSGPNQLLRKNVVLAVKPQTGFAAYGNGTLADIQIKEKCYVLATATDGSLVYKRQDGIPYTLAPFRGYLLADLATTENTSELRMGIPTGMPEVVPGARSLHFYTGPGFLRVNSPDSRLMPIYTVEGRMVTVMRLTEGDNTITLPTGLYAVYRQIVFIP